MNSTTFAGIFCIGFVFGYLLYYAVKHTEKFNIELLSSAIGAIGGGIVVTFAGQAKDWIGPYGIGIGAGFLFYLILSLVLILSGKAAEITGGGPLMLLRKTLLGSPKEQ
ncbi:MAG TPA: hypothetical protein DHU55_03660 [Blastocatellia bacterium]|nr:hypothetical protein [Blastocatellia bacterium]